MTDQSQSHFDIDYKNKVSLMSNQISPWEAYSLVTIMQSWSSFFDVQRMHMHVFDCGSNVGAYTQLVLDYISSSSLCVHCFEPNPHLMTPLHIMALNDSRVKLNMQAIFNTRGIQNLHIKSDASEAPDPKLESEVAELGLSKMSHEEGVLGLSRLDNHSQDGVNIQVPTTTIDIYCAENSIPEIHWIKLDIEGSVLEAIQGASSMLKRGLVWAGQFEKDNRSLDEIISILDDYRYTVIQLMEKESDNYQSGAFKPVMKVGDVEPSLHINDLFFVRDNLLKSSLLGHQ